MSQQVTSSIQIQEFNLPSVQDNLVLSLHFYTPETDAPKGILQLVHGMCEHKERYRDFLQFMTANGFVCVIHDHRGHGASLHTKEDLGYMYSAHEQGLIEDVRIVCEWVRRQFPGLPLTLFGHSMGSMVVRSFCKRYDHLIDTLFVCGSPSFNPLCKVAKGIAKVLENVCGDHYRSKLLARLSFIGYNKGFEAEGFPRAWVCSNKACLERYHNDPLCNFTFTANGFVSLYALMMDCYNKEGWKLSNPQLPVFFISGGDDPCRTSNKHFRKAVNFMRDRGYQNVDSRLFPHMRHELLNEVDKRIVWDYVLTQLSR